MRKDNYFIALVESGILDVYIWGKQRYFNVYFEWVIWSAILNFMFDETEARMTKVKISLIKLWLLIHAFVAILICIPVLLLNFPLEFFRHPDLSNFSWSKGFGNSLGLKTKSTDKILTDFGYWKLREYNELKHLTREWVLITERNMNLFVNEINWRSNGSQWFELLKYIMSLLGVLLFLYFLPSIIYYLSSII